MILGRVSFRSCRDVYMMTLRYNMLISDVQPLVHIARRIAVVDTPLPDGSPMDHLWITYVSEHTLSSYAVSRYREAASHPT